MLGRLHDPQRLTAEGQGAVPTGNDTEEGRAQNRRIDVILQRQN